MAATRRVRLGILLVAVVAMLSVAAWGIDEVVEKLTDNSSGTQATGCTAGGFDISTDQASVAAQMVAEVYRSGVAHRDRAAVLVLAAAMQESKLANLPPGEGDRDSVGVLQQRPSQDWGKARNPGEADTIAAREKRLNDVTEATREFLDKLVTFDGWWTEDAAVAIQDVQVSADGSLYAQHEPIATALAKALLGTEAAGITCTFDAPSLVAGTSTVVTALKHQLGLTTPVASATAVRVPGAGWQTAAWFVANADRYGIAQVEYADRTWTRAGGWATPKSGASSTPAASTSTAVVATMAVVKNKK